MTEKLPKQPKKPRPQRIDPGPTAVLLVDKPQGPTSFDVVQVVRRLYGSKSAGHTGTLDPMATGLLPICLGDATRIASFLSGADKTYVATIRFGITTDTLDAEGTVLETRDASGLTHAQVADAIAAIAGPQRQAPPMFSAAKIDGKRLYELARAGETVEREERDITVYEATLLSFDAPDAVVRFHCSKGTYIRVLAETLGARLGTGAHLAALRRTTAGPFDVASAKPLDLLKTLSLDALRAELLTVEQSLAHLRALTLDERQAASVGYGNAVPADVAKRLGGAGPAGTLLRLVGPDGGVIAVGESDGTAVRLARVLKAKTGPGTHVRPEPKS